MSSIIRTSRKRDPGKLSLFNLVPPFYHGMCTLCGSYLISHEQILMVYVNTVETKTGQINSNSQRNSCFFMTNYNSEHRRNEYISRVHLLLVYVNTTETNTDRL